MAWEARSGLKQVVIFETNKGVIHVGMAWEARSGLKHTLSPSFLNYFACRNGLGSPFGFETSQSLTGDR